MTEIVVELGTEFPDLTEVVDELVGLRFASRLVGADATLWGDAAQEEASIRLGWIDAVEKFTRGRSSGNPASRRPQCTWYSTRRPQWHGWFVACSGAHL